MAILLAAFLLLTPAFLSSSFAQTPVAASKPPAPGEKKQDKMLVQANELVFDKDKNTVSAVGDAQIYYQGRILEADRVIYDRNAKRVYAEGHANSFAVPDAANTGLESGLDKKYSDYVARQTLAPISAVSFTTKEQFDSETWAMKRFDFISSATYGPLTATLDFGKYSAQPELGYFFAREGLLTSAKYKFADHWSVNGTVVFDMSRHYYDVVGQNTPVLYAPTYGFGLGYNDECTTVNLSYTSTLTDPIASTPQVRDQTVLLQITLRTLGEVRASTTLGDSSSTAPAVTP